jgi:hypothetical protein
MTTKGWIITAIAAVLILVGVGFMLDRGRDDTNGNGNGNGDLNGNGGDNNGAVSNMIRVTSPVANAVISSPLTVTGEARGGWYFEADFPVRLLDGNGREIGMGIAQAQGEWMTTNFVPFVATVTFTNPTTTTGTLVLEKDNPSGLPENAAEYRVPVRFSSTNAQTRSVELYYYNESRDRDASGNIMCSAQGLQRVTRQVPITNTPIQDTIRLLISGELTATERAAGLSTEYPLQGFSLNSASLSNGVLTLAFSDPQNRTIGGSCRVSILWAQIEATARQFAGVNQVRFTPDTLFQP